MNKLTTIFLATTCAAFAVGCAESKDDEGTSNASATVTVTVGDDGDDSGTAGDDADDDGMSATMPSDDTMSPESSGGPAESTGGDGCTVDDECMTDAMCPGGMCIGCICTDVGESSGGNPSSSDYGPCDMCAPGEMPVGVMDVDGCFCSPGCDGAGSECPAPTAGMVAGQCVLVLEQGSTDPTQCALVCMPGMDGQCPPGATCEMIPMQTLGLCMFPVPM